jgi:nucleotide-binding universal stress UspA family protein
VVGVNPLTGHLVDAISGDEIPYREVLERDLVRRWIGHTGFAIGELAATVREHSMPRALDDAATEDRADAIVVGAHHAISGIPKRIGHATNKLLRLSDHPVVVVPRTVALPLEGGAVVVGIGHGDATRSAVRWAAHLARNRDVSIELVHALGDAPVFQATGVLDAVRYGFTGAKSAERQLVDVEHFAELMRTLTGAELDVAISTPPGLAALRLDDASRRSSLLVIGRHRSRLDGGHHTAQPLRHVLSHAQCPVAVIPDHLSGDLPVDVGT